MQIRPQLSLLQAIFFLSSKTLPITRARLAQRLRLGSEQLDWQLMALDRAGLIDEIRLRLTLPGLAVAVAMRRTSKRAATGGAQLTRAAA